MPKTKKRGKGNKSEKEKPLLTVQGVLRLEKSFITAQHEGAQTMEVVRGDTQEKETIKLIPGQSEHDLVSYKAGYDVGPSNPNPQNETEKEIFEAQKKVDAREEHFQEMVKSSQLEKEMREKKFKEQEEERRRRLGLLPLIPPGTEEDETAEKEKKKAEEIPFLNEPVNVDDPKNYHLPEHLRNDPAFHNDLPLEFGSKPASPEEEKKEEESQKKEEVEEKEKEVSPQVEDGNSQGATSQSAGEEEGHETQEFPEDQLPQMKPLPEVSNEEPLEIQGGANIGDMALTVAKEMEEKRKKDIRERIINGEDDQRDMDDMVYSLDEMTKMNEAANGAPPVQGPEFNVEEAVKQKQDEDNKAVLASYWQFVRSNPQDFNGWCYLVQHAENIDDLDEVRRAYNDFLPLFPFCYAYWQRYSGVELKHENWERGLAILHRGLEAIPMSIELWVSYLDLYLKMYKGHEDFEGRYRIQCERAIQTVGLEYKSDVIWERYLEWLSEIKDRKWTTGVFRRLVSIPTRLYNRHWDNFIAHVRDHHPRDILERDEYEDLRKATCEALGLTYRPDPVIEPAEPRKVVHPEDKLKSEMKERIVASVVDDHERCEAEVDKRSKFEDRVKRNYFHVKPMDLKQLRNWDAYLDFEIKEGDHERILVLFERCLIPCAHYEQFWAKYARYLEKYHKEKAEGDSEDAPESPLHQARDILAAFEQEKIPSADHDKFWSIYTRHLERYHREKTGSGDGGDKKSKSRTAFGTGMEKVDKIREERCSWTLRGWKGKDKEGNEVMMADEEKEKKPKEAEEPKDATDAEKDEEAKLTLEDEDSVMVSEETENEEEEKEEEKTDQDKIDAEMSSVLKGPTDTKSRENVRDVYKRACIVHCPKKAMIKLKWASFEEQNGEIERAKEILEGLSRQFPLLLECCMQMIDLERRCGNIEKSEELYKKLLKKIPQNRRNIKTWVAMKFARFLFKVSGQPDKALATLRSALKKERGEAKLYSQIIDVCYQRHPVDVAGVTAAIELAIKSPDLKNIQKLEFVKRKVEFMQEFGDVGRYRDACDQMKSFRVLCAVDLKAEAKRKKEMEKEAAKLKELEALKARVRADANIKAKVAESEGKLMCTNCQAGMYPNEDGVYEFEKFNPEAARQAKQAAVALGVGGGKIQVEADEDGVVDLMDLFIPEDQEEQIKQKLEEKTKYKEVAPTWELNMEVYGYGKKRKTYDPDYEHIESSKFKEYERLEGGGYDEELKDPDHDKLKNLHAPGLGHDPKKPRRFQETVKQNYTTSDYIVPPKVPQLSVGMAPGRPRNPMLQQRRADAPGAAHDLTVFELPPEIANPQRSPCVNVPEWFVKEGGELCLSETNNGMSVLRYWPKFLSEKGNHLMFNRLRKYCKWHQKQVKIGGEWKYETRLVAWYGPCEYNYSGLALDKNLNWAPELLDLLHRLIAMTRHEFNSCFLNLYRHGHDMCGWHADVHPQLGRNPPVASVSLGAVRVFEFRKKSGPPNFIRFPLFPGSLLVMEGATQEDWLHCLPRDVNCKEERINLTFRIMYSIDKR